MFKAWTLVIKLFLRQVKKFERINSRLCHLNLLKEMSGTISKSDWLQLLRELKAGMHTYTHDWF